LTLLVGVFARSNSAIRTWILSLSASAVAAWKFRTGENGELSFMIFGNWWLLGLFELR